MVNLFGVRHPADKAYPVFATFLIFQQPVLQGVLFNMNMFHFTKALAAPKSESFRLRVLIAAFVLARIVSYLLIRLS